MRSYLRALVLVLPLSLATLANGAEPGWTPLFEGADLTGWRYSKGDVLHKSTETPDRRFVVQGGAIVLAAKDKDGMRGTKDLLTVREFNKDFELKLEFKASNESIASIVIRNTAVPVGDFKRRNEQGHLKNFKTDDWNELVVTVKLYAYAEGRRLSESDSMDASFKNGRATVTVNGRTVDPNRTTIQVEAWPKIGGDTVQHFPHAVVSKGFVGIRSGTGKVEFRNIRWRELQ